MFRVLTNLLVGLAVVLWSGSISPALACGCTGCGCKGGPGFRGPDGRCVGYKQLTKVCGQPATTNCVFEHHEQVCEHEGALPADPKAQVAAALATAPLPPAVLPSAKPPERVLPKPTGEPIAGRASVIDGDTIEVHSTRIRLFGIDAPESAQTCEDRDGKSYRCGQRAALALSDRIGVHEVACDPVDRDRYGRTVAVCFVEGDDLGAHLVEQGLAVAFRRYSTAYVAAEAEAQRARLGIWAGTFVQPAEWRRQEKRPSGAAGGVEP